jgi:hypothetical protein
MVSIPNVKHVERDQLLGMFHLKKGRLIFSLHVIVAMSSLFGSDIPNLETSFLIPPVDSATAGSSGRAKLMLLTNFSKAAQSTG